MNVHAIKFIRTSNRISDWDRSAAVLGAPFKPQDDEAFKNIFLNLKLRILLSSEAAPHPPPPRSCPLPAAAPRASGLLRGGGALHSRALRAGLGEVGAGRPRPPAPPQAGLLGTEGLPSAGPRIPHAAEGRSGSGDLGRARGIRPRDSGSRVGASPTSPLHPPPHPTPGP